MDSGFLSVIDFSDMAMEMANLPVALTWLYIAMRLAKADNKVALIMFIHFGLVYVTSMEFILSKFADQTHYAKAAMYYRTGIVSDVGFDQRLFPSLIFALFPLPQVESTESVAMINVILYAFV
ncbi:MAG: hypothetical protein HQL66_12575 [Magnetococcales bacterium]|nr:hypothetical protein [Magnetococcales bacterium]